MRLSGTLSAEGGRAVLSVWCMVGPETQASPA